MQALIAWVRVLMNWASAFLGQTDLVEEFQRLLQDRRELSGLHCDHDGIGWSAGGLRRLRQ